MLNRHRSFASRLGIPWVLYRATPCSPGAYYTILVGEKDLKKKKLLQTWQRARDIHAQERVLGLSVLRSEVPRAHMDISAKPHLQQIYKNVETSYCLADWEGLTPSSGAVPHGLSRIEDPWRVGV